MRAFEFLFEDEATDAFAPDIQQIQQNISAAIQQISSLEDLKEIYKFIHQVEIGPHYSALFNNDPDLSKVKREFAEAIAKAPGTKEEKIAFAKELTQIGIVDETLFTNAANDGKTFSLDKIIATDYPEIYKSIMPMLLDIKERVKVGGKAVNRGTGEFFLALLSPNIQVGAPGSGDVIIDKKPFEVKSIYARLSGTHGFGRIEAGQDKAAKIVSDFSASKGVSLDDMDTRPLTRNKFYQSVGPSLINADGIPPAEVQTFMKNCMITTLRGLYTNMSDKEAGYLSDAINENGVLDFEEFAIKFKNFIFNYYKTQDKWTAMIFFDQQNNTVTPIWTAETFANKMHLSIDFPAGSYQGPQIQQVGIKEPAPRGRPPATATAAKPAAGKLQQMAKPTVAKDSFYQKYGAEAKQMIANLQSANKTTAAKQQLRKDWETMLLPDFEKKYNITANNTDTPAQQNMSF